MPVSGRLTDRFGGGTVSVAGLIVTVLATVPLALSDADTSMLAVQVVLVFRGARTAFAVMPAVSAAYATVARTQLPDATAQVNILQRVGGSVGGALLVVILARGLGDHPGSTSPEIFAAAFWWLTGMTMLALLAATALLHAHRSATGPAQIAFAAAQAGVLRGK